MDSLSLGPKHLFMPLPLKRSIRKEHEDIYYFANVVGEHTTETQKWQNILHLYTLKHYVHMKDTLSLPSIHKN